MRYRNRGVWWALGCVLASCGGQTPVSLKSFHRAAADTPETARERFAKNFEIEFSQAHTPALQDSVRRKYDMLGVVLDEQIQKTIREPWRGPNFTASYHPLTLREVQRVTADYGPLYVGLNKNLKGEIEPEVVTATSRPWAGFWYPANNASLYEGADAPLVKFDHLMSKIGRESNAAQKEKERNSGRISAAWEGLCDAWSLAAVTTVEPSKPKTIHGIVFSVADLKALSTFSHLKYDRKKYGIPYLGTAETDGTFDDISPEAFHQLVVSVLGKEQRAIVMDVVPGEEVWNKPIQQYRFVIRKDEVTKKDIGVDAFLVDAWAWVVNHRQKETNDKTATGDILVFKYTYRLYVDIHDRVGSKYRVVAGQWLGESVDNHPDTVMVPARTGQLGSHNAEFNKHLDAYKKLFID